MCRFGQPDFPLNLQFHTRRCTSYNDRHYLTRFLSSRTTEPFGWLQAQPGSVLQLQIPNGTIHITN